MSRYIPGHSPYDSVAEYRYFEARPHLARLDGSVGFDSLTKEEASRIGTTKLLTSCSETDTISECSRSNET